MSTVFRPYSESEALRSDRSAGDRKRHREKLRRSIRENDVFWWVDAFLRAAIARDLRAFPQPEHVVADDMMDHTPLTL